MIGLDLNDLHALYYSCHQVNREPEPDPEPEPWTPAQNHTIQCVETSTQMTWGDPEMTSLTELYLQWNQITDITPLSALTSLNNLALQNNQITDLTPLSALTSLTELGLRNNPGRFSNSDETVRLLTRARGCKVYF